VEQELSRVVFYITKTAAEGGVRIGLKVLSFECEMHRQFASMAPGPIISQRSIVGPRQLAKMVFYITKTLTESGVLISLMVP
jgi:hypothetical protein